MGTEAEEAAKAAKEAEEASKGKEVEELKKQIENLNKGIAGYRDTATNADKTAKEALKRAEEAEKKAAAKAKADEVPLSDEEEKKFRAWAEKNGVATKKDLEEASANSSLAQIKTFENQAVSEFLEKHPEYDDEDKWKKVAEEFNQYKTPTTLIGFKQLLDKVHKNLGGGSTKEQARAQARAEISNRSRLSLGGKNQGNPSDGDDETAVEELQKKYPSLAREVIEKRLAEIRSLYKKDK